jgi:hypothetical protein
MRIGRKLFGNEPCRIPDEDARWHLHVPMIDDDRQKAVILSVIADAIREGRSLVVQDVDDVLRTQITAIAEDAGRGGDIVRIWAGDGDGHPYLSALRFNDTRTLGRLTTVLPFSIRRTGSIPAAMWLVLHTVENFMNWAASSSGVSYSAADVPFLSSMEGLRLMGAAGADEAPPYITTFARRYLQGLEDDGIDFGDGIKVTRVMHDEMVAGFAAGISRMSDAMRCDREGFSIIQAFRRRQICLVSRMPASLGDFVSADLEHAVETRWMEKPTPGPYDSWEDSIRDVQRDPALVVVGNTTWIRTRGLNRRFETDCIRAGVRLVIPTHGSTLPDLLEETDNGIRVIPINVAEPWRFGCVRVRGARWVWRRSSLFHSRRHPEVRRWYGIARPERVVPMKP